MNLKNLRNKFSYKKLVRFIGQVKNFIIPHYASSLIKYNSEWSRLKNLYTGKRAFIIGNGPSLNKIDLELLKNEVTIASNGIFLLFDLIDFRPTIYTVEDNLVAEDRSDNINNIRDTIKVFPKDLKYCLNKNDNTIFIDFIRRYPGFPKFSKGGEKYLYWGGTVTFMNMQIAYYLGIREVYLIGIDHHYHTPTEKDLIDGTVINSQSEDKNHFNLSYFGPGFRYHDPKVERMEQAYVLAKEAFESEGGIIYNATAGGKLEVFRRVSYESLFK